MGEQTFGSISIAAEAAAIVTVLADLPGYPGWTTGMSAVNVLEKDAAGRPLRAAFNVAAGPITDRVELGYDWADDRVRWHLLSGNSIKALNGEYAWHPAGDGTEVTYRLELELNVGLPGFIRRAAEQTIVSSALSGLKRRVEAA